MMMLGWPHEMIDLKGIHHRMKDSSRTGSLFFIMIATVGNWSYLPLSFVHSSDRSVWWYLSNVHTPAFRKSGRIGMPQQLVQSHTVKGGTL